MESSKVWSFAFRTNTDRRKRTNPILPSNLSLCYYGIRDLYRGGCLCYGRSARGDVCPQGAQNFWAGRSFATILQWLMVWPIDRVSR